MQVDYIEHMGSDLSVVNAARVSFSKVKKEFEDSDVKLIKYLVEHNHWTPFAHPQISLRIKAPVFLRTQCFKHKQGFVENEVSRRYVNSSPEFYFPKKWRGAPTDGAKQGSTEDLPNPFAEDAIKMSVYFLVKIALERYEELIKIGVAPEQARMILPQNMYTEWIWTGSLAAFARFYNQRIDPHAQKEIQELAQMVSEIIEPLFPISWKVLKRGAPVEV